MKLSSKPISSPGRTDKFPPPLMRFLRSSAGSRSRRRSRASPMFFRKAHNKSSSSSMAAAESTQEPSSPKITCMGQVRVGRSKKPQPTRNKSGREVDDEDRPSGSGCRCACISRSLLCDRTAACRWRRRRSRSNSRRGIRRVALTRAWRDCSSFFQVPCRRRRRSPKTTRGEDSPRLKVERESEFRNGRLSRRELRGENDDSELKSEEEEEDDDDEEEVKARARAYVAASSSPSSPPKNALLLTRCRSAPYRSSSLACRFWGSPLNGVGEAQKDGHEPAGDEPKPLLASEGESRVHPEEDVEEEEAEEEITVTGAEKMVKPATTGELKPEGKVPLPPAPRLTRCKSEPARTAAQKVGFR